MNTATTVDDKVALIKREMPETYTAIAAKAQVLGKSAYALVRRGLRGEPNCFWAVERGWVMGTPFSMPEVERDIAQYMVSFGAQFVVVFGGAPK